MTTPHALARFIPDIPRNVFVRDLLLNGDGAVFGRVDEPEPAFVLQYAHDRSVFIYGTPSEAALLDAVRANGDRGEVIAPPEAAEWVARTLPDWTCSKILLHSLEYPERLPSPATGKTGFVEPDSLSSLGLPPDLLYEIKDRADGSLIAASYAGKVPVAFCYCSAITETLWDISIDTLEPYRRQGHAGLAVAHMIRYMQNKGRQPVWAAEEGNPASWRLAQKLGFGQVDELALWQKDKE